MTERPWVCVHSERGEVGLELLAPGRALADQMGAGLAALLVGSGAETEAREHLSRGADCALVVPPGPGSPGTDFEVEAMARAIAHLQAQAALIGATAAGTEVAARLAQRLGVGCAGDCSEVEFRDGSLRIARRHLGRFVCRQIVESRPALATVPPGRFEIPESREPADGRIERLRVDAPAARLRLVGTRPRERSRVRIDRSEIVVAVGRGLGRKEDLSMVEEVAAALGGAVGASRPLTDDLQWLPADVKIGLSGATVRPRLYVACGISGQIEHTVGMRESGVVVAVNSDPGAPIMQEADFCVVGDLHAILPALARIVRDLSRPAPR